MFDSTIARCKTLLAHFLGLKPAYICQKIDLQIIKLFILHLQATSATLYPNHFITTKAIRSV